MALALLLTSCARKSESSAQAGADETVSDPRPAVAPPTQGPGAASRPVDGPGATPLSPSVEPAARVTLAQARPADRRRYKTHLRIGRKHSGDRAWAAAIGEFEAALRIIPDEPHALSELGWAAFRAGDMERARAANEKAVALSEDSALKAASLYNLGRIAEEQGDTTAAIEWYGKSVELRPIASVQARMVRLRAAPTSGQPAPAPQADKCENPSSQELYCACMSGFPDEPDLQESCSWEKTPFARLWLVTVHLAQERTDLVELRAGVWHEVANVAADDIYEDHDINPYSVKDSGRDVLVLQVESSFSYRTGGSYDNDVHELLCVVGASEDQATDCPLRLHVKSHSIQEATDDVPDADTHSYSWALEWTLAAGAVRLLVSEQSGDKQDLTEELRPRQLFAAPTSARPSANARPKPAPSKPAPSKPEKKPVQTSP